MLCLFVWRGHLFSSSSKTIYSHLIVGKYGCMLSCIYLLNYVHLLILAIVEAICGSLLVWLFDIPPLILNCWIHCRRSPLICLCFLSFSPSSSFILWVWDQFECELCTFDALAADRFHPPQDRPIDRPAINSRTSFFQPDLWVHHVGFSFGQFHTFYRKKKEQSINTATQNLNAAWGP
jgi:hypothetical protein